MTSNDNTKVLFFDIDGTLITGDSRMIFPESAKEAIKRTREKGNLVFINSGRLHNFLT